MKNEVDIWFLDKSTRSQLPHTWDDIISPEEQQRANRFHFEEDKESFIFYHGCKRLILSHYLHLPPNAINIAMREKGKPFLVEKTIHFNLSHTKNLAILAVSKNTEIGVDIEQSKQSNSHLEIAKRFFHPEEYNYLKKINSEQLQQEAFFVLWTSKEAVLKATGEGISSGLDAFSVHPELMEQKALAHNHSQHISLVRLATPAGYVASLAAFGHLPSIIYKEFSSLE